VRRRRCARQGQPRRGAITTRRASRNCAELSTRGCKSLWHGWRDWLHDAGRTAR
jgi:hypothetical protein